MSDDEKCVWVPPSLIEIPVDGATGSNSDGHGIFRQDAGS